MDLQTFVRLLCLLGIMFIGLNHSVIGIVIFLSAGLINLGGETWVIATLLKEKIPHEGSYG